MPRRKKSESESPELVADAATSPEATEPRAATGATIGEQAPSESGPKLRPVRQTFTSAPAGIRAGEDKRFNAPQAFVDFDDDKRATDEEKAALREAGFRYRPSDKGYSALAKPETREARDELAQKFTERRLKEKAGPEEGPER